MEQRLKNLLKKTIPYLKEAIKSEDSDDYRDEEDGWGPASGAEAHRAKEYNLKIKKLIKSIREELRSYE